MKFPPTITRASAGTGKTFQLSNRYLGLVHHGEEPSRILATTFARKAAGEIQDRILTRLADAIEDDGELAVLAGFIPGDKLDRPRCRELLRHLTANLHRLRVGTIDSFFAQLARSFALELGIPPGWQIISEQDDQVLRDEAIMAVLAAGDRRETLELVHWLTKGEASRGVSELLRSTVTDLYELFQETDETAWHQLPDAKPLPDHELALVLDELREYPLEKASIKKGRDGDLDDAALADWPAFLKDGIAAKVAAGEEQYNRQTIEPGLRAIYQRLVDHASAVMVNRVKRQTEGAFQWLSQFHQEYQRLKAARRAMRFDDVTRAVAGVSEGGDVDRLAFRLGARIDHLLLDEFQDTSPQQWQAVRPFAKQVTTGEGDSFYCVGDIKQAIYGWRGGVAEIFDTVASELGVADGEPLTRSFRSSQVIIDAVNEVFTRLTNHTSLGRAQAAVADFQQRFPHHQTAKDLPGYACLQTAPLKGPDEDQTTVTLRYAAKKIADLAAAHPGRSIGVLTRKNDAIGTLIYELRQLGVQASEEGGNPLTDSAAVLHVISLLQLADHPGHDAAAFHLANSPWARDLGLDDFGDKKTRLQLSRRVRQQLLDEGYGLTVYRWAQQLSAACNRRELSRLKQLVELAYAYEPEATLRTRDFVRFIRGKHIADPTAADVRVMTIHKSKGLEFDIVVLPQLDHSLTGQTPGFVVERPDPTGPVTAVMRYAASEVQALLPARFQQMFADHTYREATELMCVLYVAMTRAIHALHMIITPSSKSERNPPQRLEAVVRCALNGTARVEPETTVWTIGEEDWQVGPVGPTGPASRTKEIPKEASDTTPLEIHLKPSDGQLRRGLDSVAPSSLHHGPRIKVAEILRREDNIAAMLRGSIIHAWFEAIEWLDDGPPPEAELRRLAAMTAQGAAPVDAWLKQFHQMLTLGQTREVLSRAYYGIPPLPQGEGRGEGMSLAGRSVDSPHPNPLPRGEGIVAVVRPEFPFVYREDGRLWEGSIDRLVLLHDGGKLVGADVIDFKTDTDLTDPAARHGDQLQAYRSAVSRYFGLPGDQIAARLLMVKDGSLVDISA